MNNYIFFTLYCFAPLWLIMFYWHFGITKSWSEYYYKLKERNYLLSSLFTLFTWSYAIPAVMISTTPLMIFAGISIAFVGAAPDYRFGLDKKYHGMFAKAGVLLSQLSILFEHRFYILSTVTIALMLIVYLYRKRIDIYTNIIETIAYLSILIMFAVKIF